MPASTNSTNTSRLAVNADGSPVTRSRIPRKRMTAITSPNVAPPLTHMPSRMSSYYGSNSKTWKLQQPPRGPLQRIRNCVLPLLMMSLPISIFMLPHLITWRPGGTTTNKYGVGGSSSGAMMPSNLPRMVVALAITEAEEENDTKTKAIVNSLLRHQSWTPDAVYVVVQQENYQETTEEEPLPDRWQELMVNSESSSAALEIVQAPLDVGSLTSILAVVKQEQHQEAEEGDSTNQDRSTRVIVLDQDEFWSMPDRTSLVQTLVEASLQIPQQQHQPHSSPNDGAVGVIGEAVVGWSGGDWRSHFRQVSTTDDKFPNLFLQSGSTSQTNPQSIDWLWGTICFPLNTLPSERLEALLLTQAEEDQALPDAVHVLDSLWLSAIWEQDGIPKWILPSSISANSTSGRLNAPPLVSTKAAASALPKSTLDPQRWISTAYYLQHRFQIWKEYELLDWSSMTEEQISEIDCEYQYEQDCSGMVCVPNPESCPNAEEELESLTEEGSE